MGAISLTDEGSDQKTKTRFGYFGSRGVDPGGVAGYGPKTKAKVK